MLALKGEPWEQEAESGGAEIRRAPTYRAPSPWSRHECLIFSYCNGTLSPVNVLGCNHSYPEIHKTLGSPGWTCLVWHTMGLNALFPIIQLNWLLDLNTMLECGYRFFCIPHLPESECLMALFPTLGTMGHTDLHTHPTTTLGFGQLLKKFWEHGKEKGAENRGRFLEAGGSVPRGPVLGSRGPGWKDVSRTCIRFDCVLAFAPLNILTNVRRTLVASED